MNHRYFILLFCIFMSTQSCQHKLKNTINESVESENKIENKESNIATMSNIESNQFITSTNIGIDFDSTILKSDLEEEYEGLPINAYTYPRTKYTGSAGVVDIQIEENGFKFVGASFQFGNYDTFKNLFESDASSHQDFFTVLCLVPKNITNLNAVKSENKITSRNFPKYYLGQGKIRLNNIDIDYVSLIDAEGAARAIINERIFDLSEKGKTIIIIPKSKGELYFIQIKTPPLDIMDTNRYYKNVFFKNDELKELLELSRKID